MKRFIFTILAIATLVVSLVWFFIARPEPPFAGVPPIPIIQSEPTYFAELDSNGKVLRVIVITQEMLNTGRWGDPKNWVQTYMDKDGKVNPKGKYAGKGDTFDKNSGKFNEKSQ